MSKPSIGITKALTDLLRDGIRLRVDATAYITERIVVLIPCPIELLSRKLCDCVVGGATEVAVAAVDV